MSVEIPLDDIPENIKEQIHDKLVIRFPKTKYNKKEKEWYPYAIADNMLYLPLFTASSIYHITNTHKKYSKNSLEFTTLLRPYQEEAKNKILHNLTTNHTAIVSLRTGGGKTLLSICIAALLGYKTLIVTHRNNIKDQWEESIKKSVPKAKIQRLETKSVLENADFYLITSSTINKLDRKFFDSIGLLIIDEVHAMLTENCMNAFLTICPEYTIALSATPKKDDPSEELLTYFFGTEKIELKLHVAGYQVYQYKTDFEPEMPRNKQGDPDWTSVIKNISENTTYNDLIVDMCLFFKERYILILCKRKVQAFYLYEKLQEQKESVGIYTSTMKKYDDKARILVTTFSKSGVGFDHPLLDMLIVACDVEEYFLQYLGRVFRREDVLPIVVDIVHKLKQLNNHWLTRKKVYLETGGNIFDFKSKFPRFENERNREQLEIIFDD